MQDESTSTHPDREIIELPEQDPEDRPQSALARAVLGMTLLVIGATAAYAMYFHSASSASGAVTAGDSTASASSDASQLSDFLTHGKVQLPAMRAALGQSEPILRTLTASPQRFPAAPAKLQCNPFRPPVRLSAPGHASPTTAPSAQIAQKQQETERAAMLQAVEAMQLQSVTTTDSHRSCMINDALYDEGGAINGFTIEQINDQSVVIRNGLYRFELTMNR